MTRIARVLAGFFLFVVAWVGSWGSAAARELAVKVAAHEHEMFFELVHHPRLDPGPARTVVLALDSSRSLAGEPFDDARAFAISLAERLERVGVSVRMVYGDYRAARCPGAGKQAIESCLEHLEPGGATDLEALLVAAVDLAGVSGASASVLLISDGRPAFGERVTGALVAGLQARIRGRDLAVHTALFGEDPDRALLSCLARSLAGTFAAAPDVDTAAQALRDAVMTEVAVEVVRGDVSELVGSDSDNLARAAGFRLAGKLTSARARVRVRGVYRGRRIEREFDIDPEHAPHDPGVVTRWAGAAIAYLRTRDPVDDEVIDDIEARYLPEPEDDGVPMSFGRRARRAPPTVTVSACGSQNFGYRDKNMIRRAVRARLPQMRQCYMQRLRRDRRLAGQISLALTIAPDGSVHDPRITHSSLGSAAVEACVLELVASLAFPALHHGHEWVDVHYPFAFEAPDIAERELLATWAGTIEEHLAAGRVERARMYIERRMREIADNGLGDDALLALLGSERARAAFRREFERAARARIAQPALPTELARDLFGYFLQRGDADVAELFQRMTVDTNTGAFMLDRLAATQRATGERLARAWLSRRGPAAVYGMVRGRWRSRGDTAGDMGDDTGNDDTGDTDRAPTHGLFFPELVWDVASSLAAAGDRRAQVMDDLLDSARQLGREPQAIAPVLQRCTELQGQGDRCIDWLVSLQNHAPIRAHLRRLFAPMVQEYLAERRASPAYNFGDFSLAQALMFTGQPDAAVRVLSELVEQYPDDEDSFREFAVGLMRMQRFGDACARIHAYGKERRAMDSDAYVRDAYADAWGEPAPGGLCRLTR